MKSFYWYPDDEEGKLDLYVQKGKPSGLSTIIISNNFFKTNKHRVFAENVKDFGIKNNLIFVTKLSKFGDYDLYVSHNGNELMNAIFAQELNRLAYYIADVTGNRIMVAVAHAEKISHLYVSEGIGNGTSIYFSLSLENILCYMPNTTRIDTWWQRYNEDDFTDFYKAEGLTGILK